MPKLYKSKYGEDGWQKSLSFNISKNKRLSFWIATDEEKPWNWFYFTITLNRKGFQDHHGFEVYLDLFSWCFSIKLKDKRHAESFKTSKN